MMKKIPTVLLLLFHICLMNAQAVVRTDSLGAGQAYISESDTFKTCENQPVHQYYHQDKRYGDEMCFVKKYIKDHYKPIEINESGFLTVRFIVNCEGKIGNFIVYQVDEKLNPCQFSKTIIDQLMKLTQELQNWSPMTLADGRVVNYRAFLTFKIKNGYVERMVP